MTLVLALTAGTLFAVGTYLLLQRTLSRVVIGLVLLGNGANVLLLLAGGEGGAAAIVGGDPPFADPLPQAMILTAIVITFGVTAFLLALVYRSWLLEGDDEVEDDLEDRRIARLAEADRDRRELQDAEAARLVSDSDRDPED